MLIGLLVSRPQQPWHWASTIAPDSVDTACGIRLEGMNRRVAVWNGGMPVGPRGAIDPFCSACTATLVIARDAIDSILRATL